MRHACGCEAALKHALCTAMYTSSGEASFAEVSASHQENMCSAYECLVPNVRLGIQVILHATGAPVLTWSLFAPRGASKFRTPPVPLQKKQGH